MNICPVILIFCLLSYNVMASAQPDESTLTQQLNHLQQRLPQEQHKTRQWLKALERVARRNQKRLQEAEKYRPETLLPLQALQQEIEQKKLPIESYRVQLKDNLQRIPAWLSLSRAQQTNRDLERQIHDIELLLENSQPLNRQAWLLRAPEELWRQLAGEEPGKRLSLPHLK